MIRCGQISKTCDYYSALMLTTAYHSIYAATHPGMSTFLHCYDVIEASYAQECTIFFPWERSVPSRFIWATLDFNWFSQRKIIERMFWNGKLSISLSPTPDRVSIGFRWLLCALEQNCMAPNGSQLHCEFGNDVMGRYGDCHRQDQSAVNILVGNRNNYEEKRFLTDFAYANRDWRILWMALGSFGWLL